VVDNQEQSTLIDIWRVYRPAQTRLRQWLSNEHFDFVDGAHEGYKHLVEPITHRRQIFFAKPEYWVVLDLLTGRGAHCFDLYFHLRPDIEYQLEAESGVVHCGGETEPGLMIAPMNPQRLDTEIVTGATAPIQGWVSFFSGEKQPAPVVRYRQERTAPVQFCTVLYPYPASKRAVIRLSPLEVRFKGDQSPADQRRLTGLQIETEAHLDYLLIDQEATGVTKIFAGHETNGYLVYLRRQKKNNQFSKIILRGGDRLLYQGQSLLERHGQNAALLIDQAR
jgi:hypothetical protein